ncbi:hypothetical protein EXIGLDRAFT_753496 [Exidia glandulosa HHB12029]|uniref:Uncharacterized protein n=1 Tax=Exidia glandulosa HHB12029 TaxID=1314781 RepID=A0A165ZQU7_EXIGL|nr:hypothetical protein EXIGLDRAFT_753496 [Exidia glandulosa HHB12029]
MADPQSSTGVSDAEIEAGLAAFVGAMSLGEQDIFRQMIPAKVTAHSVLEGLQDGHGAGCCPACLSRLGHMLQDDGAERIILRDNLPDLWDACMAAIALPRSDAEFDALRVRLRANITQCQNSGMHSRKKPSTLAGSSDPLDVFVDSLYWCLRPAFMGEGSSVLSRTRDGKGLRKSDGNWPTSIAQLLPHGDARVVAHLEWACKFISFLPQHFLTVYLVGFRPRVFRHFASHPARALFVWYLVRTLLVDLHSPLYDWPGEEPVKLPAHRTFPTEDPGKSPLSQLFTIFFMGPDANSDDMSALIQGYELVFFRAVQHAIGIMSARPNGRLDKILRALSVLLQRSLHLDDSALDPRVLEFKEMHPYILDTSKLGQSFFLATVLVHDRLGHACAAPVCERFVQDDAADGRRECQKRDWKEGYPLNFAWMVERDEYAAHKTLCPTIARIAPLVRKFDNVTALAGVLRSTRFEKSERRALMDWALAREIIPAAAAARFLGFESSAFVQLLGLNRKN